MKIIKTILFWLLSCTWGIIMTIIGLLTALGLLISGKKPHKFGYGFYFIVEGDWGGVNLGPVFIVSGNTLSLKKHESGHGIQNIIYGPFFPLLVGIPSMARYQFREVCYTKTQTDRYKWIGTVLGTLLGLTICLTIICAFTLAYTIGIIGFIVGASLTVYLFALMFWFVVIEIPKYEILIPDYYDVWFEAQANTFGKNMQ